MQTCYLLDDEPHAIKTLSTYIAQTPGITLSGSSTDPLEAMEFLRGRLDINIVFADIDMPKLNGLELAELLGPNQRFIFTTAHANYAVDAFEQNALDFLLKPVSYSRFLKAVAKVKGAAESIRIINQAPSESLFINPGVRGKMTQVYFKDIVYIEGLKNYIIIYTTTDKHITYLTMNEIEEALPDGDFLRVQKSYIVNTAKIKATDYVTVTLEGGSIAPVGKTFKDSIIKYIEQKALRTKRR